MKYVAILALVIACAALGVAVYAPRTGSRNRHRRSLSAVGRGSRSTAVALVVAVVALSACGSQRDSSRVAAMIDAKYGVKVVGCSIEQGSTVASLKLARQRGLWSCELSAPRRDKAIGVTGSAWCVTNASPDELYESADLAYPRSMTPHGCR